MAMASPTSMVTEGQSIIYFSRLNKMPTVESRGVDGVPGRARRGRTVPEPRGTRLAGVGGRVRTALVAQDQNAHGHQSVGQQRAERHLLREL